MRPGREQTSQQQWKQAYLSALFESNKASLPVKIAEARQVMLRRRLELFNSQDNNQATTQERQALDTAMFSLEALKLSFYSSRQPF
jgi:hypothetical protein